MQNKILKTDLVSTSLLTNVNGDIEELFTELEGKASVTHSHGIGGTVAFSTGDEAARLAYTPLSDMLWYQDTDMLFYFYDFSTTSWEVVNTTACSNTGLSIEDIDASHKMIVKVGSNLLGNRTFTITTGDADRELVLESDVTLGDWFDQGVKTTDIPTFAGLTIDEALSATVAEINTVCDGEGAKNNHTHDHSTKAFTFTTDGTWTKPTNVTGIWVLLVGAGGGGGYYIGGGGGGGQILSRYLKVTDDVTVTIGVGGAAGVDGSKNGSSGGSTILTSGASLTAIGGGGADGNVGKGGDGGGTGGTGGILAGGIGADGTGSVGGAGGGGGGGSHNTGIGGIGGDCVGYGGGGIALSKGGAGGGSYGDGAAGNLSAAANSGAGGGGGNHVNLTAGAGGSGYCVIMHVE